MPVIHRLGITNNSQQILLEAKPGLPQQPAGLLNIRPLQPGKSALLTLATADPRVIRWMPDRGAGRSTMGRTMAFNQEDTYAYSVGYKKGVVYLFATALNTGNQEYIILDGGGTKCSFIHSPIDRESSGHICFSPNGALLYTTSYAPSTPAKLLIIDAATLTSFTYQLNAGVQPYDLKVDPNHYPLYIGNVQGNISVIDPRTKEPLVPLTLDNNSTEYLAVSPTGKELYAATHDEAGSIYTVDLRQRTVRTRILGLDGCPLQGSFWPLQLSHDGKLLFCGENPACNQIGRAALHICDFSVGERIASTIPLPTKIAGGPYSNTLYHFVATQVPITSCYAGLLTSSLLESVSPDLDRYTKYHVASAELNLYESPKLTSPQTIIRTLPTSHVCWRKLPALTVSDFEHQTDWWKVTIQADSDQYQHGWADSSSLKI
jgi:hypothetical protein